MLEMQTPCQFKQAKVLAVKYFRIFFKEAKHSGEVIDYVQQGLATVI